LSRWLLSSEDGAILYVQNRFARKSRHRVKFSEAVLPVHTDVLFEMG